jgi:hypothetical protein
VPTYSVIDMVRPEGTGTMRESATGLPDVLAARASDNEGARQRAQVGAGVEQPRDRDGDGDQERGW